MGKTVKIGGTEIIKGKEGQKPLAFKKGTLHAQLKVPQDEKIPVKKMRDALNGEYGELAQKRARFAKNILSKEKKLWKKRVKRKAQKRNIEFIFLYAIYHFVS